VPGGRGLPARLPADIPGVAHHPPGQHTYLVTEPARGWVTGRAWSDRRRGAPPVAGCRRIGWLSLDSGARQAAGTSTFTGAPSGGLPYAAPIPVRSHL